MSEQPRENLSQRIVRQLNEMTAKQPGWRTCPACFTGYDRDLCEGRECPTCRRERLGETETW